MRFTAVAGEPHKTLNVSFCGLPMAIKKQEFYEGAAIYLLARTGLVKSIRYESPFFRINETICALLKHSTRKRSPWAFTVTPAEQSDLQNCTAPEKVFGLICGSDGVVSLPYESYLTIALPRDAAIHISCYRNHNEHYEINGPEGTLTRKIAPSAWPRILNSEQLT